MMYGQSQMSNWLQRDVSKFLHYHGLSDTGMRAMHEMGLALGTTTFYRTMQQDSSRHLAKIDKIIRQAMRDKKLIVVIIDDYSNIHTRRRPQDNPANISHMATVILRVFDLPAIAVQQPPANFPGAINIHLLLNNFLHNMPLFFRSFIAGGPQQLNQYFFNPHNERLRLTTHMYGESNNVRQVRGVANAHLIDCTQQTLKSLTDSRNAANVYLHTALQEYLQQYQLLIPGDWPSQFYQRQLSYNEPQDSLLRNTTAMMGPLHVSLNAQENAVLKVLILANFEVLEIICFSVKYEEIGMTRRLLKTAGDRNDVQGSYGCLKISSKVPGGAGKMIYFARFLLMSRDRLHHSACSHFGAETSSCS